jgi:hypothetical protein
MKSAFVGQRAVVSLAGSFVVVKGVMTGLVEWKANTSLMNVVEGLEGVKGTTRGMGEVKNKKERT